MTSQLFVQTLPPKTAKLAQMFQDTPPDFLNSFYLSGGTALSLQIGHRESEDLDFFIREPFDPEKIQASLSRYGKLDQAELLEGTFNTFLDGVKLQFLEYPYDMLESYVMWDRIQLSSISDIACTKLLTISSRGSKKDFIDFYFLLDRYTLDQLFVLVAKKYPNTDYSKTHILKSLAYFEDADQQPVPRMHREVSWEEVKRKITNTVKNYRFYTHHTHK